MGMRIGLLVLCVSSALETRYAVAQVADVPGSVGESCVNLNTEVLVRVANGRSTEAVQILSESLKRENRLEHLCAGLAMNNMAGLLSVSGRLAEAEVMAERSIRILDEIYPSDDPALLRPLQILAAARFEQGKTARAREAFKRMQLIRIRRPEDRVLVNAMAAALLEIEGRWTESESQYSAAIQSLKSAGRGNTADAGALLNGLGGIYIKEQRMTEARQALDEALAIFERAPDADSWDRIKVLQTRGALRARQREWRKAEEDMANALSIADRESRVEPTVLRSLLIDYAAVLRKNHRRREARSIEMRIAALGRAYEEGGLVDVTDLLARQKARR
jgi:tetratricopeptide (TPR) repeat protein